MRDDPDLLVELKGITKRFPMGSHVLTAVNNLHLTIHRGETLGLVGESGCGKSTVGKTLLRLSEPSEGQILFDETDVTQLSKKELLQFRRRMQIIFQDPYASLNPRMTVEEIVGEALVIHRLAQGHRKARITELLQVVGLNAEHLSRYPHEFSGGQRQRIGIARALAVDPEFIVCDEPLSALDVSVQAQVVNLLRDLQERLKLTYLFIAHDLSMVQYLSHRVAVMYLGNLVELAPSDELYTNPLHPYTKALLSAIPVPDPKIERKRTQIALKGEVPSPLSPPSGCVFHTRCPFATEHCKQAVPEWRELSPGHHVACHYAESLPTQNAAQN